LNINEKVGIKLKELRSKNGYSLEHIASRIGKARQTVHKYEKGMISISLDDLQDILNIYGIDVGEFLDEHRSI